MTSGRDINIHFIRHVPVRNPDKVWYGETADFDDKSEIVQKFLKQLAATLPSNPETTLWISSPYPRAKATAEGVLSEIDALHKPSINLSAAFIELQYGVITGKRHATVINDQSLKAYLADMWDTPLEGGESMKMLQTRVGNELDRLLKTTPDHITDIVIFAHGGVAMAAFAHATGQRMIDVFKARKDNNLAMFAPSFSYQSNLRLRWSNQKWQTPVYSSGVSKHAYRLEKEL